jgi:hypothetical protein
MGNIISTPEKDSQPLDSQPLDSQPLDSQPVALEPYTTTECYICREKIDANEKVTCLNCKIILHKSCNLNHIRSKKYRKCPYCAKTATLFI